MRIVAAAAAVLEVANVHSECRLLAVDPRDQAFDLRNAGGHLIGSIPDGDKTEWLRGNYAARQACRKYESEPKKTHHRPPVKVFILPAEN